MKPSLMSLALAATAATMATTTAADPEPARSPAVQAATITNVKEVAEGVLVASAPATNVESHVAVEEKNGKTTLTITVEKDGRRETRTLVLPGNTPLDNITGKLLEEFQAERLPADPPPEKSKVTYLGVMLNEPASFPIEGGGGMGPSLGGGAGLAPHQFLQPGSPSQTGLTVSGITPGSPAEKAGLQTGDVLTKLNDQILINPGQFTTLIRTMKEGEVVKLSLLRNGENITADATLASREESSAPWPLEGHRLGHSLARILTLDSQGNIVESVPGTPPLAVPAPAPGTPPLPPTPPLEGNRPGWENTLREAAAARDKASAQWQEQLAKWRSEWAEGQKKASEEYRKVMEKMSEEIAKAREAAEIARDEARRAIEETKRKIEEHRSKSAPAPDQPEQPGAPEAGAPENAQPKSA